MPSSLCSGFQLTIDHEAEARDEESRATTSCPTHQWIHDSIPHPLSINNNSLTGNHMFSSSRTLCPRLIPLLTN